MFEREFTIVNPSGLHARPATQLTQFCKQFPNSIQIIKDSVSVNPKSIVSLMAAGLKMGTTVLIRVEGEGAQETGEALWAFLSDLKE